MNRFLLESVRLGERVGPRTGKFQPWAKQNVVERESLESRGTKLEPQNSESATDITEGCRSEDGFRYIINRNLKVSMYEHMYYVTPRRV